MPTILFVCTANQIRSVLAAAFFRQELETRKLTPSWVVESAGVWAADGIPASSAVQDYLRKMGLPGAEDHRSRRVSEDLVARAGAIIVMENRHRLAIQAEFPLAAAKIHL